MRVYRGQKRKIYTKDKEEYKERIEKKGKKEDRKESDMEWDYLSDEELDRLVKDAEAGPLCPAPEYLKPMILEKAESYDRNAHKLPPEIRLLAYSVKIMAAAAAAVIMIFTVPVMDKEQSLGYMEQSVQEELERTRDRLENRNLSQMQDRMQNRNYVNALRDLEEKLTGFMRMTGELEKE